MRSLLCIAAVLALAGCQKKSPEVQPQPATDAAIAVDSLAVADAGAAAPEQIAVADAGLAPDADGTVTAPSAPLWMVKDNKTRCIQAPCMSLDAMPVGSSDPTEKISDVDLSALGLSAEEQQAVMAEVYGKRGVQLEGEIVEEPSKSGRGGMARVLKVTRRVK